MMCSRAGKRIFPARAPVSLWLTYFLRTPVGIKEACNCPFLQSQAPEISTHCAIYSAITSHTAGTSRPSFQLATPLMPWLCITWSFTRTESTSSSQH